MYDYISILLIHLTDLQMESQKKQRDNRSNIQRHKNEDIKKLNQNYIRTAIALMHIKQVQLHENIHIHYAPVYQSNHQKNDDPTSHSGLHGYNKSHYDLTEQQPPTHHVDWKKQITYTDIRVLLDKIKQSIRTKSSAIFADMTNIVNKYNDKNEVIRTVYRELLQIQSPPNENQNEKQINELIAWIDIHIESYNILYEIHRQLIEENKKHNNLIVYNINTLLKDAYNLSNKYKLSNLHKNIATLQTEWKGINNNNITTLMSKFEQNIVDVYVLSRT